MATTWKHPKLGEFKPGGFGWEAILALPAFKAFSYDTGRSGRAKTKFSVSLEADQSTGKPSARSVALLEKIVSNQEKFSSLILNGLWDEFNGDGPDTNMWWNGDLDAINEQFEGAGLPLAEEAADLLPAMRLANVAIYKLQPGNKTVADFIFNALFEQEHGLSVITDGKAILGTGFIGDVAMYDE